MEGPHLVAGLARSVRRLDCGDAAGLRAAKGNYLRSVHRWFVLVVAIFLASTAARADGPPRVLREFRAAWIATVANIDWPSEPGVTPEQQQKEVSAVFDKA